MQGTDALLIVDTQVDFCPGGALAVADGDQIIPVLNGCIERFKGAGLPIIATRDWHPDKTSHFSSFGGQWPPHCVQGSRGADFHPALALPGEAIIISKGMGFEEDSYSGFQGKDATGAKLAELLQRLGVQRLLVGGLATDYCVKHTVLDAIKEGFEVVLLEDAIRGVNLQPTDSETAIEEMIRAGAQKGKGLWPSPISSRS